MHAKLLKISEVLARTAQSKSSLYRNMKAGSFPQCLQISEGRVAWLESEIESWISGRPRTF